MHLPFKLCFLYPWQLNRESVVKSFLLGLASSKDVDGIMRFVENTCMVASAQQFYRVLIVWHIKLSKGSC